MRVSYTGDPSSTLQQVYDADKREYDAIYRPLNREAIRSVESTEIVDTAKANAQSQYDNSLARERRMAERFGIDYTAFEQAEQRRRTAGNRGLNYDQMINTARFDQYERNNKMRNEMVAVGRGIDSAAYKQLQSASDMHTQRVNANSQMRAQNASAKYQMMGMGAAAGITAATVAGAAVGTTALAGLGGAALFAFL